MYDLVSVQNCWFAAVSVDCALETLACAVDAWACAAATGSAGAVDPVAPPESSPHAAATRAKARAATEIRGKRIIAPFRGRTASRGTLPNDLVETRSIR